MDCRSVAGGTKGGFQTRSDLAHFYRNFRACRYRTPALQYLYVVDFRIFRIRLLWIFSVSGFEFCFGWGCERPCNCDLRARNPAAGRIRTGLYFRWILADALSFGSTPVFDRQSVAESHRYCSCDFFTVNVRTHNKLSSPCLWFCCRRADGPLVLSKTQRADSIV